MKYSTSKDMDALCLLAESTGWVVQKTNGGHVKLSAPNGKVVFCAGSPSDRRAVSNTQAKMWRAWPEWPGPVQQKSSRPKVKKPGRTPRRSATFRWDGNEVPEEFKSSGFTLGDLLTIEKPPAN